MKARYDWIGADALPEAALLRSYREAGAYTDCFTARIAGVVSQAEYVEAFYTTGLFKLERLLLAWFVARPSTDAQARALAAAQVAAFAAWIVEARTADQLLLCDIHGRTRSWLMSAAVPGATPPATLLYFGSAVIPINRLGGLNAMGPVFRLLLVFHKVYARLLLRAAISRLLRAASRRSGAA